MRCNRCGKEINELEIFCDECKNYLKSFSSKKEVNELENLIEDQKELNELENTKELINLDKLVEEEIKKEEIEVTEEIIVNESKKKSKTKKIIIILSIIFTILLFSIVIFILFINKGKQPKEEPKEVVIDYEKVINTYGNYIANIIKEYMSKNEDVPTWKYVIEQLDYDRYDVECGIHNIYSDGTIYLSGCKVDGKNIQYTFGEEKEEIKEGKKLNIYKQDYDGFYVYSGVPLDSSTLEGTITCKTEDCDYVNAYNQYVLIQEEDSYYLYDYTNDLMNFGPFILNSELDVLVHNNDLYGLIYQEENNKKLYNVNTGKILKNIKGNLLLDEMGFYPTLMYGYNYAVLINEGKNNFVNLKTGNISYTIKEHIISFEENNNIVYITALTDSGKYKIYNSNGKSLFGGKEYSNFILGKNNLLISTENNFKIYDKDLKLKTTSNNYDEILGLYEEFVVVLKGTNLMILSIDDKVLANFENVWDKDNNKFYYNLSNKVNDKITLIVENKKVPSGTKGNLIEYYYNISTKESGFIEKETIDLS